MPRPVQPGYLGVQSGHSSWRRGLETQLIKLGTFSRYNHAAIVTRTGVGGLLYIIEAAPGGVRGRWTHTDGWVFGDGGLSVEQQRAVMTEAVRQIGVPYDYWDIVKFVIRFWTNKVPRRTRPDYADDRVICSELVAWCLHVAGVEPWPTVAYGAVSPGDIADWLFRTAEDN